MGESEYLGLGGGGGRLRGDWRRGVVVGEVWKRRFEGDMGGVERSGG